MLQGQGSQAQVLHVAEKLKQATQGKLAMGGELPTAEALVICELQGFANGLWWAMHPGDILLAPNFELVWEQLGSLGLAPGDASVLRQTLTRAFEDAEYYKQKLLSLQAVKSKFIKCRRLATEATDLMDDMSMEELEDACQKVEGVLRLMPRLLTSLGDEYTKQMTIKVLTSLNGCAASCLQRASENEATVAELRSATKMLQEATAVFPFDTTLGAHLSELGDKLAEQSRSARMSSLMAELSKITDGASLVSNATHLKERLTQAAGSTVNDATTKALQRVVDIAAKYLADSYPCGEDFDMGAYLDLSDGLAELLPKQVRTSSASVFPLARCGIRLTDTIDALVAECFTDGAVNLSITGRAQSVKAAQVVVEQSKATLQIDDTSGVATKMAKHIADIVNDGQAKLNEIGQALATSAKNELKGLTEKLQDIGGGLKGGKNWLEGLSPPDQGNWKKLNTKAQTTLCKETEVAGLRPVIDGVDQARGGVRRCTCQVDSCTRDRRFWFLGGAL